MYCGKDGVEWQWCWYLEDCGERSKGFEIGCVELSGVEDISKQTSVINVIVIPHMNDELWNCGQVMVWGCVGLYGMVGVVESFESFVNVM